MTNLKTLKDLIKNNKDELTFGGYTEDILKKEAIKWVKEDIKMANKQEAGVCSKLIIVALRWKERFNLTEEELK